MAQFILPDIPGSVNRGLQFAQQQKMNPLQVDAAELAIQGQEQNLRQGEQSMQFNQVRQQGLEQQIAQRTSDQKNKDFVNSALRLQSLPDDQKLQALLENKQAIIDNGGDTSDTDAGIELAQAGNFEDLNQGLSNIVTQGERQGIIQQTIKKTASQQDFDTFKQLTAKANETKDPVDTQLAEQFGRQSGFDRETPQELADIDVQKESKKTLVKQAATASKEAFDGLKGIRKTIANIDDAIKTLDKGAETGPVISKLPSFRQAAIELDNIKGRMGLDVVGATTFGALSESELAFALNVALPDSLEPKDLKEWLTKKRDSQTKLSNELRKAASFLGTPGNTIAGYLEKQEKENPNVGNLSDDELFK
jgi:hypothetical protein